MLSTFGSVLALLLGTAFLLTGSGLYGLLLPLRGQMEGFAPTSLGLLGTAWAGGFIAGCLVGPRLVRRVGHVRSFAAFAATGAIMTLLSGIWIDIPGWIILRAFNGFSMAGAFMVIESWLNERSTNETRGAVFGLYMMVTYLAITAGQMSVALGDVSNTILFMVAGILFCLALLPTAVSAAATPAPLADVSLHLKKLYINSPVAAIACLLIGAANGAWGSLGPVYGAEIGISTVHIAMMMSVPVIAGAAGQLPVGRLSDRTDRRFVLAGAAFTSALIGAIIFIAAPRTGSVVITMTALYGLLAFTLYSVTVAHANDHAAPEDFAKVSSGLLLLYGAGTMVGPVLAGGAMHLLRPESVFLVTAVTHLSVAGYAVLRIRIRPPVPPEEKEAFTTLPSERAATPQTAILDPRGESEESDEDTPDDSDPEDKDDDEKEKTEPAP